MIALKKRLTEVILKQLDRMNKNHGLTEKTVYEMLEYPKDSALGDLARRALNSAKLCAPRRQWLLKKLRRVSPVKALAGFRL